MNEPKVAIYVHRNAINGMKGHNPYHQENRRRLDRFFCTCGYIGKPAVERKTVDNAWKKAEAAVLDTVQGVRAKPIVVTAALDGSFHTGEQYGLSDPQFSVHYRMYCPQCNKNEQEFVKVSLNVPTPARVLAAVTCFDDTDNPAARNKRVVLSFVWSEYYYNEKADKVIFKKDSARITYNAETHRTWISDRKKVRELTYASPAAGMPFVALYGLLIHATKSDTQEQAVQSTIQWIEACAKARDLKYLNLLSFMPGTSSQIIDRATKFAAFLRFPILQNFPFKDWGMIDKDLRKFLQKGPSTSELFEFVAGSSSKLARKYITDEERLDLYSTWGHIILEPDNLRRLLGAQHEVWEKGEAEEWDEGGTVVRRGRRAQRHATTNVATARNRRMNAGREAHEWLKKFHRDEAHYVRCLLKMRKPITHWDWETRQNKVVAYEELNLHWINSIVMDIYRMGKGIEDVIRYSHEEADEEHPPIEAYEFNYRGDIFQFHEDLTRDYGRMGHRNRRIPYTQKEYTWNMVIDDHHFELAPDTHTLVEVGSQMNICVGGYSDFAMQKGCTIINVKRDGKLMFCIEVQPQGNRGPHEAAQVNDDTEYSLNQVKKHFNEHGTKGELEPVVKWLKKAGIKGWQRNYDMKAYADEAYDQQLMHNQQHEHAVVQEPQVVEELMPF